MTFTTDVGAGAPLIQAHNLTKKYEVGQPALNGLTLDVQAGEALAVIGPSDGAMASDVSVGSR